MASLGFWRLAQADPGWTATVDPDGTRHRAGDLLATVSRLANGLRAMGLRPGDGIAALLPNGTASLAAYLAATGSGLYFTPINWHFTAGEIAYIVADSGAKAFIADVRYAAEAVKAADEAGLPADARLCHGEVPGFRPVDDLLAGQPAALPDDRTAGASMHYTSGTTGRPKGVRRQLSGLDPEDAAELATVLLQIFGAPPGQPNAHLVTSPNYHTAVTVFGAAALHLGHTVVYMDRWDAEQALALVERYRITSTHMVPTHFKRMLSLPEGTRNRYDLSSMRWLIHAAAPCPVPLKRAMLDWWGPRIYEYYAATEGGGTIATPQEWLERPGTVGRPWPMSEVRVLDDDGRDCPPGVPGTVFMKTSEERDFAYKGDPDKTAAGRIPGFFTVGDIGYLDDGGYLFLCDRKADVIISGGANIYPAEIESELMAHPKIADVAVFGIPDDDWGEQVMAVVEPAPGAEPGPELAAELIASLDGRLARMKWPRSVDFIAEMPRDPSGKLRKRQLRDSYWQDQGRAI